MNKCNIKIKKIHESIQAILDYWDSLEDQGDPQLASKEFNKRMKKAKTCIKLGDNQEYWQGYEKGLNRRFLGSMLGPEQNHQGILNKEGEGGKGYRDGFSRDE